MKKIFLGILFLMTVVLCSCTTNNATSTTEEPTSIPTTEPTTVPSTEEPTTVPTTVPSTEEPTTVPTIVHREGYEYLNAKSAKVKYNFGAKGFVEGKISDFSIYENTSAYRKVTNADELLDALADAKYDYTNTWVYEPRNDEETTIIERYNELASISRNNDEKKEFSELEKQIYVLGIPGHLEQALNKEGTVHVIEIMNDLELGYNTLTKAGCDLSLVDNFLKKNTEAVTMSSIYKNYGISQIKIEKTSNLLIFSKNGAKITHCGFKLSNCNNIAIRNLAFDEIWQWEDSSSETPSLTIGDYDAFGCAYFKLHTCGYVWFDHCTFGKAYDGLIDVAHASSTVTTKYAPYGSDGGNGVHISNCHFAAGSDDENGYLYKMMDEIEEDYINDGGQYLYYKTLRDMGISKEEILYGLAIPQKKGFLLGDGGDKYDYNLQLKVSFANNIFTNIEDRLPKIRGGIAVLYNNIVDASQYALYRNKLSGKGAGNINDINSKYKCALVSQGIVCGLGASVYAECNIYKGVSSLLKNNDSESSIELMNGQTEVEGMVNGGYRLVDFTLEQANNSYNGSTTTNDTFLLAYNSTQNKLKTSLFNWHTKDGNQPFTPNVFVSASLETVLTKTMPVGVNNNLKDMYLFTNFEEYKPL